MICYKINKNVILLSYKINQSVQSYYSIRFVSYLLLLILQILLELTHNNSFMMKKIKLKVPIIGPPNAGKTAFIQKLVNKVALEDYQPTQGYQLSVYNLSTNINNYQVHLWDCGTQHMQNNKFIRQAFFHESSATFILFNLSDKNWQEKFKQWVQQAYRFECYLVYAIGTKMDILERQFKQQSNQHTQQLRQSLLGKNANGRQWKNQFQEIYMNLNNFFSTFQIKHFYQNIHEPFCPDIRNIFVSIYDDRQKLSRSSLARGIKFDNSIIDAYMSKQQQKQRKKQQQESIKKIS